MKRTVLILVVVALTVPVAATTASNAADPCTIARCIADICEIHKQKDAFGTVSITKECTMWWRKAPNIQIGGTAASSSPHGVKYTSVKVELKSRDGVLLSCAAELVGVNPVKCGPKGKTVKAPQHYSLLTCSATASATSLKSNGAVSLTLDAFCRYLKNF